MGKINLLSFEVANLIAAGEVVDRPASAVKEMMENSIDAHAKHITVEIQNGGVTFMRVSDDGDGMEPDDIPLAIRRHATSKISNAEDLDGIETLGFRGEALAAISSVSEMRIISKMKDAPYGAMLEVSCGQIIGLTERGCSDGTTIIIENLFANVPARRKFLKRDVTEAIAVTANVEKIALSHPDVAIKFISDGQVKLETAGDGNLKSVVWSVFGKDFASKVINVESVYDDIRVYGVIGRSDNVKANRNGQNFFINHRYIKSKTATAAIEQAYTAYMPPEKYPVCVLFIQINPKRVDVNVHPAKLEVKFSNEKPVFEAIYYSVKQALESNKDRPDMTVGTQSAAAGGFRQTAVNAFTPVNDGRRESVKRGQTTMDFSGAPTVRSEPQERITAQDYINKYVLGKDEKSSVSTPKNEKIPVNVPQTPKSQPTHRVDDQPPLPEPPPEPDVYIPSVIKEKTQTPTENSPIPEPPKAEPQKVCEIAPGIKTEVPKDPAEGLEYRLVGEVFNSYIIVERGEKMLIIDKHAAHERIIFEKLKANMYASDVPSQMLMLPIEVMLTSAEVECLNQFRREIESVGFAFDTARNTVFINCLPAGIQPDAVPDMITVIAGRLENGTGNAQLTRDIIFEKALFQASCKAAIKAGRVYPEGYSEWVVSQLINIPDITFCPHGRPVAMEMSKRNLDKQFERT